MKKILLYAASLATLILAGCEKEQSELSVDDVKAKATISGKVTYDGGSYYDKTDAKTVLLSDVAASNVTVVVKVENDNYNGDGGSFLYFETQTDANGLFSIDVPVYNSLSATVYNLPFYGTWQEYDGESNIEYSNVLMKMTPVAVTANEKDVKYISISTSYENVDQFKD